MIPADTLEQITARFQFLEAKMAGGAEPSEIAELAKEYSELKPVVTEIEQYQELVAAQSEAEALLSDPEMKDLAEEELLSLRERLPAAER